MPIPLYQIDAFASRVFAGNPAAVCPLDGWPEDGLLQAIAQENNLSETAFFVPEGEAFRIRWFTPVTEVDLCGHATLAAAFVIFGMQPGRSDEVVFESRSGTLRVRRDGEWLVMDFPAEVVQPCAAPAALLDGLGVAPLMVLAGTDYLVLLSDEAAVRALRPDMRHLERLDRRGVIVTAPGREADFVSRFFAPRCGIDEDPVTGSAHCALTPFWTGRLGRQCLRAQQVSRRGGELWCELKGDRVAIAGQAVQYLAGQITL
ncbi:PhzF family phenazine biosynthesis protein [Thermithiobacillus tepidarius DSM 3134]|uniref:PhzF family phenazine biosynthesis protein n=1 Tax=Thermithiobacillus tepidarius TaxID=929 RepID=UPI00041995AA|nr:PhzF family phenazine biosynthesis protein [Thermithiobacillus tepidarius]